MWIKRCQQMVAVDICIVAMKIRSRYEMENGRTAMELNQRKRRF